MHFSSICILLKTSADVNGNRPVHSMSLVTSLSREWQAVITSAFSKLRVCDQPRITRAWTPLVHRHVGAWELLASEKKSSAATGDPDICLLVSNLVLPDAPWSPGDHLACWLASPCIHIREDTLVFTLPMILRGSS